MVPIMRASFEMGFLIQNLSINLKRSTGSPGRSRDLPSV
jgi:hypothetical protein